MNDPETAPPNQDVDEQISELARAAASGEPVPAPERPTPRKERGQAPPKLQKPPSPVIAAIASVACFALTLFNLGGFEEAPRSVAPAKAQVDLAALASVEASLLENHHEEYGAYPRNPVEAGLEPEGLHYTRLSPHAFEMTLESDGVAVTIDSDDLAEERESEADDGEEDWQ